MIILKTVCIGNNKFRKITSINNVSIYYIPLLLASFATREYVGTYQIPSILQKPLLFTIFHKFFFNIALKTL